MGGGGLRSNGNMWNPLHGCVGMYNHMMCSNRNFAWEANSWGMLRGRYELNLAAMAVKQYTSCIRMSRCHKILMPDGVTHNAAISACEKGQKPQ